MNKYLVSLFAATGLLMTLPAAAQFQKPEDAIKYRKAALTVMGTHFSRIGAMVNNRVPFDAKAAADNADIVAQMSKLPFAAFGPGTDKGDTRAKPEVWTDMDKFRGGAGKLQEEAAKLAAAAKVGTPDALKAAFGEAAKTCKACHDDFRKE